jgi:hypothetical protein
MLPAQKSINEAPSTSINQTITATPLVFLASGLAQRLHAQKSINEASSSTSTINQSITATPCSSSGSELVQRLPAWKSINEATCSTVNQLQPLPVIKKLAEL